MMRFIVHLPTHVVHDGENFVDGDLVAAMALAVEEAGFDGCAVTDHPFPAVQWLREGGHHAFDPLVLLSYVAAGTRKLKLLTHIFVLPYRNPYLAAKSVASLDVLSGGRVLLGVASGYLEDEFRALSADYTDRNAVTDEALVAMKLAWLGKEVTHTGTRFDAPGNVMLPPPVSRPHPPIWIGGNTRRAIRRAVEHGQVWSPFPNPAGVEARGRTAPMASLEDLARGIAYAREYAQEIGRVEPLEFCFAPVRNSRPGRTAREPIARREEIDALRDAGVTWGTLRVTEPAGAPWIAALQELAEEVLPR